MGEFRASARTLNYHACRIERMRDDRFQQADQQANAAADHPNKTLSAGLQRLAMRRRTEAEGLAEAAAYLRAEARHAAALADRHEVTDG